MKQGVRRGSGVVAGWALLALLTGCGEEPVTDAGDEECQSFAGLRELTLRPAADAYIWRDQGDSVHGAERKLVADNLSRRSAFLRFEVPALPGPLLGATLRLYALDGSTDGPALYAATSDWNEDEASWAQEPTLMGGPLGDVELVPNGSWVEYDVTTTVTGLGTYGFALVTESRNGVDFASKEHSNRKWAPRLVLQVDAPAVRECLPMP